MTARKSVLIASALVLANTVFQLTVGFVTADYADVANAISSGCFFIAGFMAGSVWE